MDEAEDFYPKKNHPSVEFSKLKETKKGPSFMDEFIFFSIFFFKFIGFLSLIYKKTNYFTQSSIQPAFSRAKLHCTPKICQNHD